MSNEQISSPGRPDTPAIEDPGRGWPTMLEQWGRYHWQRLSRRGEQWPPEWAPPALGIAALAILVLLVAGLIVPLVRLIAHGIAAGLRAGAGWATHWAGARLVLDPVHRYLEAHAAGLPVTAATLWWTWCAAGIGLFALAVIFRANAARLGWVLYGLASAAMAWAASPGPSRPIVAGVAGLWWTVLALFALRSSIRTRRVKAYLPELPELAAVLQRRDRG